MVYLRVALLISLALAASSLSVRAQDPLAKWKPSVGDKFMYSYENGYVGGRDGRIRDSSYQRDTLIVEILKTDTTIDSLHHFVVAAQYSHRSGSTYFDSSEQLFYFHTGKDSSSAHSLAIDNNPVFHHAPWEFDYDFSTSRDSQITLGARQLTAYSFDSTAHVPFAVNDVTNQEIAVYSPELRWFVYSSSYTSGYWTFHEWSTDSSSSTLLSASTLIVDDPKTTTDFIVSLTESSLSFRLPKIDVREQSISLLDLLGRPIRSWQMPMEAGERCITLNVADVPNGVYFLRVSAEGVDEIKKVCIAH